LRALRSAQIGALAALFDAEDFDDDAFATLPVELRIEDALPGAEVEAAVGYRQHGFVVQEQRLQVCIAILFSSLVMLVVGASGRKLLEPFADVLDEAALVIIHIDGGGDMHRGDKAETVLDTAAADDLLDPVSDVNHLAALLRFKDKVLGIALQFVPPGARAKQGGASAFILKTAVNDSYQSDSERLLHKGLDLLTADSPAEAAEAFRASIAADETNYEAHHGLVRALRDAGRLEQSVGAALALTALTPLDPLAHTALSISLQTAGHIPEAEAAAAKARVAEWKILLKTPPGEERRG
jgi:hypothetical protein